MTVIINSYKAARLDDGTFCDEEWATVDKGKYCDTYFKIFIDDKLVHRFPTQWDTETKIPFYKFKLNQIKKDSIVRIEAWDEDTSWWNGDEDLIDKWTMNIHQMINKFYFIKRANHVDISAFWKDEISMPN